MLFCTKKQLFRVFFIIHDFSPAAPSSQHMPAGNRKGSRLYASSCLYMYAVFS